MKQTAPIQIVRITHRWTGILLIGLLTVKMLSGLAAAGKSGLIPVALAYRIHFTAWIDVPLIIIALIHALYGIYKMIQGRFVNKTALFTSFNIAGFLLIVYSILMIYFI